MAGFYLVLKENQIPQSLQRTGEEAESQVSLTTVPGRVEDGSSLSVTGKTVAVSE